MAVAALAVIGVGLFLVLLGTGLSIADSRKRLKAAKAAGMQNVPLGLPDTIDALGRLVVKLARHPLGFQLIVLGIVLVLIGGGMGGAADLTNQCLG